MFLFLISGSFSALFAVVAELALFSFLSPTGTGIDPWNIGAMETSFLMIVTTFVFVALIEESLKMLVLTKQTRHTGGSVIPSPAVLFGLGFALTEGALAFISNGNIPIPLPAITGMLVLHIVTSILYFTAIPVGKNRMKLMLLVGICIHLIYNIFLALA